MGETTRGTMDALDIASFLETQDTGVLSLANDDDAYAIPVSYAYDDDEDVIYLRLGFAPGSQKRRFLDATNHVAFVVYADTDDGWKSVVVEGNVDQLTHDSLDAAIVEVIEGLEIPYFQVHDRPATDIRFVIAKIEPTSMTGIVEGDAGR